MQKTKNLLGNILYLMENKTEKNEIIKDILTKHLESVNISEVNYKIKNISNEYKNNIDEIKKNF